MLCDFEISLKKSKPSQVKIRIWSNRVLFCHQGPVFKGLSNKEIYDDMSATLGDQCTS